MAIFVLFFFLSPASSLLFVKMIYLFLTLSTKDLAGLKEGIKCSGIITATFFLIFLPIFLALFFGLKVPKPLKKIDLLSITLLFTSLINPSTIEATTIFSTPVFSRNIVYNFCFCHIKYIFSANILNSVYILIISMIQSFSHKLISWYKSNKRDLPWRKTDDPYKIWISEIILQQTK